MKDRRTERDAYHLRLRTLGATPPRAVIGLEAEFNLFINGRRRRPEKIFGDPSRLVRRRMIPDRKSTRLNSSHRCISYAVFCLKKKNIKPIIYRVHRQRL